MSEHQHIEWKEIWRDDYLRWICGLANEEGGLLVIGRNDKGDAVGVTNAKKLLEDLPNKIRDVLGIWNPSILPQDWTMDRLLGKHPSCPFNPLIANAFFRAGCIESWGRGIEKIRQECMSYGLQPPLFDFSVAGLMLTFQANPDHLASVQNTKKR